MTPLFGPPPESPLLECVGNAIAELVFELVLRGIWVIIEALFTAAF